MPGSQSCPTLYLSFQTGHHRQPEGIRRTGKKSSAKLERLGRNGGKTLTPGDADRVRARRNGSLSALSDPNHVNQAEQQRLGGAINIVVGCVVHWFVHISLFVDASIVALVFFGVFWAGFRFSFRHGPRDFFFDPQDFVRTNPKGREFPASAATATFEPMLRHYIGVTQLLITVAAASIAFGGNSPALGPRVLFAKLLLSWSIFYGVLFCALLLWRYDEYSQNIRSYTVFWYSIVFACGFSSLCCFMLGYLAWGWGLSKIPAGPIT